MTNGACDALCAIPGLFCYKRCLAFHSMAAVTSQPASTTVSTKKATQNTTMSTTPNPPKRKVKKMENLLRKWRL